MSDQSTLAPPRITLERMVPLIFTATIFVSACLLFFVQPLFTKLVLPTLGGSPAVWTTAMLFFQTALLGGYLYAHCVSRYVPARAQPWLHLTFWGGALLFLPLALPADWSFDPVKPVAMQTLALYAVGVGLPFAFLAANAPLIQAWYRRTGAVSADDPYFLYSASNLGSMVALLSFPLLAEPLLGATQISMMWTYGFVILGLGFVALGTLLMLSLQTNATPEQTRPAPRATAAPITKQQIATWLLLAFIPSSLMLSTTTKITTDLGSLPLLWILPLALFLLSFVATFTDRPWVKDALSEKLHVLAAIIGLGIFVASQSGQLDLWIKFSLLPCFTLVAIYCHRQLYLARPNAVHLTVFYLIMSVGGALGGVFNSLVAPVLFDKVYEGPIVLLLAVLVVLLLRRDGVFAPAAKAAAIIGALAVGFVAAFTFLEAQQTVGFVCFMLFVAYRLAPKRVALPGMLAATLCTGVLLTAEDNALFVDRSFFGSHHVEQTADANGNMLRVYKNGSTVHGAELLSTRGPDNRPLPITYYYDKSPMAQTVTSGVGGDSARIGIVGLGTGSLMCYAQPGQTWDLYEIDPMVDQVARDPALFSYMSACGGTTPTHIGDARIVLQDQTDKQFDVLLIDAYSSDAVPVHLTTLEAMQLYTDRLSEDGVLVYHISNRYYDIERPLARSAQALGLRIWKNDHKLAPGAIAGASGSNVVVLARNQAAAQPVLDRDPAWYEITSDGGRVWTDDYANPLGILRGF